MKYGKLCWILIGVLLCSLCMGSAVADVKLLKEIEESFININEQVGPSVVNIEVVMSENADPNGDMEDLFRFFGLPNPEGQQQRSQPRSRATGSGFIFDRQGYIITNNHVVNGAEKILVRLWNGTEYDAEIVGLDPDTDIGVIKIEPNEPLPVAELGDSDGIRVGQFAIALGSPRQLEGTVSFGHISALGRDNLRGLANQGLRFQHLIQTDAAINLGNSGGPLCDIDGRVIGINTAIVYGANSIGFAIPINTAKKVVPELISDGRVTRGFLGVKIMDATDYSEALSSPRSTGAFVEGIRPDTPASRAGLKPYDIILEVNGDEVSSSSDLVAKISSYAPGKGVTLRVWRDEEAIDVEVELAEWEPQTRVAKGEVKGDVLGITVRGLEPEVLKRMGLEEDVQGVIVTNVKAGSPAEEANLLPGDIIVEVAQEVIDSPKTFRDIVERESAPGKSLLLRYLRGGGGDGNITVLRIPKE